MYLVHKKNNDKLRACVCDTIRIITHVQYTGRLKCARKYNGDNNNEMTSQCLDCKHANINCGGGGGGGDEGVKMRCKNTTKTYKPTAHNILYLYNIIHY